MSPQGHQTGNATHEKRDVDVLNLLFIAALLLLVIGICLLVCWGILHLLNRERAAQEGPRIQVAQTAARFPPLQLLSQPGRELARVRRDAQTRLSTYGWVDHKTGIAHIPIDRAMELLVKRGLPEVGAGQTRLQLMQSRPKTDIQPAQPIMSPAPGTTP
jgi:hypothetical protein